MVLLFCSIAFVSSGSSQNIAIKDIIAKEKIPIIIVLKDQYKPKPQLLSRENTVQSMKSFAEEKQRALMVMLKSEDEKGRIEDIKQFWVINAISCKATSQIIEELKKNPDVARIKLDRKVRLIDSGKGEKILFNTQNHSSAIFSWKPQFKISLTQRLRI